MLVVARELYRYLDEFVVLFGDGSNPDAFIDAAVLAIRRATGHPLGARLLSDDGEVLGDAITSGLLPSYASQLASLLTPFFETAAAAGGIQVRDPRHAAEWMIRTVAILILVPVAGDLEMAVRMALEPVLRSDAPLATNSTSRTRRRR
jgi:hypothetical protein